MSSASATPRSALLALTVSMLLCSAWGVSTASAATIEANCSNLQTTINSVAASANHGEGSVIALSGMCNAANLGSASGVTLPKEANFSIEGARGTTSGFDGASVTGPLLGSTEPVGAMSLSNLTFQHAAITGNGGSALSIRAVRLTLNRDSFVENTLHGVSGGAASILLQPSACPSSPGSTGLVIIGSAFRANKLVVAGGLTAGGALFIGQECASPTTVLEGNSFEGNTIEATTPSEATGGALMFENGSHALPASVSQSGNVFDSNRVTSVGSEANFGGGGEWLEGASLTSVGDRFSRNAIPGASGPKWSWGGGLGILNTTCNAATPTESVLENAVVTGNSIGAGTPPAELGGAGMYIGCNPSKTNPNHLSLLDSTITQNSVASAGIAGVDGNPGDRLNIANSIVAMDSGGDEIGGFNGAGGSLAASFSDVCAAGASSPLPGTGNICANPLLADSGNPTSFDVHETGSSPTIDAGSNALVPTSLTSDFYGNTRILPTRAYVPACTPGATVGPTFYPAPVDMGASEFGPVFLPAYALSCPIQKLTPVFGLPHLVSLKVTSKGLVVKLSCVGSSAQTCSGAILASTTETLQGKKIASVSTTKHKPKRHEVAVRIAQASFSLAGGTSATVQVKLNPTGVTLLRRFHAMSALAFATETIPGGQFFFLAHDVRFNEPKRQHKKKHKKHH